MARTQFTTLVSALPLAGGSTTTIELDLSGFQECQLFFAVTYPTTSATTGLAASSTDGCGPFTNTPVPVVINTPSTGRFYDSVGTIQTLNPVVPGAVAPQTVVTRVNVPLLTLGNWMKYTLKNNDASIAASLSLYADCG